jgi:hypothetical protein
MATQAPQLLSTDFEAAIARNKRNTVILIAVMTAISAVMGYVFGWAYGILHDVWTQPSSYGLDLTAGGVLRDLVTLPPRQSSLIGAAVLVAWGIIWEIGRAHV